MAIYYQVLGFARCPLKFLSHCFPLPALLWYSITWRLVLRYDNLVLIIPCRVLFSAALYQGSTCDWILSVNKRTDEILKWCTKRIWNTYQVCVKDYSVSPPPKCRTGGDCVWMKIIWMSIKTMLTAQKKSYIRSCKIFLRSWLDLTRSCKM